MDNIQVHIHMYVVGPAKIIKILLKCKLQIIRGFFFKFNMKTTIKLYLCYNYCYNSKNVVNVYYDFSVTHKERKKDFGEIPVIISVNIKYQHLPM